MEPTLHRCRNYAAILFFLLSLNMFGQLSAFTLSVTPTPQTCLGNGSLAFSVLGTTPGATITYDVFLLPNVTTPLVSGSNATVSSLAAGNYRVVATQMLGNLSNTQTADTTIVNNVVNLTFGLTLTDITCNNNGVITVNVFTGNAVSYQITRGPMTRPAQASNVFSGMAPGIYRVAITNNCGETFTRDVTLTQQAAQINIAGPSYVPGPLAGCNLISVYNAYEAPIGIGVIYPLSVTYTVFPPGGGAAITRTQVIATGDTVGLLQADLPFYYNQQYSYNVVITDACGNNFVRNNNIINKKIAIGTSVKNGECSGVWFSITPTSYVGPYTINFTSSPAGFNPLAANPQHPTFNDVTEYGSATNPIPEGSYTFTLTDACGHTESKTINVTYPPDAPSATVEALCGAATGSVKIQFSVRTVAQVTVTQAPPAYTGALPGNLSAFIAPDGSFFIDNIPQGDYMFVIVDSCGESHNLPVSVTPTPNVQSFTVIPRAGCTEGFGSIRVYGSATTTFTAVRITAAPAAFTGTLPFDISSYISTAEPNPGQLFINNLPEGVYTIAFTDQCNFTQSQQVTVAGYHITTNNVTIIPHCGSFDIDVQHTSTGNYAQSFWLQKYNAVTGKWEHPQTGVVYDEGTTPTFANAVFLNVNTLTLNLDYVGHFRVLKVFYVYDNGVSQTVPCIATVNEFDFDGGPAIIDVTPFPCANGTVQAVVTVFGVPPFTYAITSKNGDTSFLINNGTSSVFQGLTAGRYNFRVSDNCGNVRNKEFTINAQDPVAVTATGFCEGEASTLSVPGYTFLSYQWFATANPTVILSTSPTLNFPAFNSATQAGEYTVRIIATDPGSCLNQTLVYTVGPNVLPNAGTSSSVSVCNGAAGTIVNLAGQLGTTYDAGGVWADVDSAGTLTGSNFNTAGVAPGTYRFSYTVTGACATTDVATVTVELKAVPVAPVPAPQADVCVGANVQLTVPATSGAVYSWTGPNGFTSSQREPQLANVTQAQSGTYSVTVTVNGCTSAPGTVSFNVVPLPFAGNDATLTQCNPFTNLDLFFYIGTGYTTGGTWTDVDATGALSTSSFNTALVGAGTYHFKYSVSSPCGITDDALVTITLNATPAAPVVSPVGISCEGSSVQLTASAVSGAVYAWTGPNGFTSSLQNPVLANAVPAQSGLYEVTVTANGCTSPAASVNVIISPAPNAGVTATENVCNTGSIINLFNSLGTTYDAGGTWTDLNAAGTMTAGNFNTVGIAPGTYNFKYEVTSACGATDNAIVTVVLNNIPNAPVVPAVAAVCEGQDVQLTADPIIGAVYSWAGPNGFTASVQNPLITAAGTAASGVYSVTVTLNGCTSAATTTNVLVKPRPQYTIEGDAVLCAGQSTVLEVLPANFNTADMTYTWYKGTDVLANTSTTLPVTDFGDYTVEVNNGTCTASKSFNVSLNPNPFDVEPIAGCENNDYIIRVKNIADITDVASVSWTGPGSFTASGASVDITGEATGVYKVTVTQNGGCSATGSVTVTNTFCAIPKGISPGDGEYNEEFDLSNLDVRHLKIFNRYGLQVYEKYDYKNEWHGQSDKGDLPTGTYFYVVTLSKGKQLTGWVYLLRKV